MAAAAAETDNYQNYTIDQVRPAAYEIYGRSLRTIYRLGVYAAGKAIEEVINSPEADQAKVEFYTSVEEGFGTDLELGGGLEVRDFDLRPIVDGKVMSKDKKTAISDMTAAGLICAEAKSAIDPHFMPQFRRSEWDHFNALSVNQMAGGETSHNTIIVASPYPQEAAARSGDEYWENIGYVPHLRRGFIQLYHMTDKGLVSGSLSFDGSDKQHLREVFGRYGVNIPDGEVTDNWLKYAITANLTEAQAKTMATEIANQSADPRYKKNTNTVNVTHEHRAIMDKVFYESYVQACESHALGRQTPATRKLIFQLADKAGKFNKRYAKALYQMRANEQCFTDDDMVVIHELLVYSTIEMMRALHLGHEDHKLSASYLGQLDTAAFQDMLSGFGAIGAEAGRSYSACGLSISAGEKKDGPQGIFGGVDGSESNEFQDCEFTSKACPFCGAKNVKTVAKKGVFYGACGCNSKTGKAGKKAEPKLAMAA